MPLKHPPFSQNFDLGSSWGGGGGNGPRGNVQRSMAPLPLPLRTGLTDNKKLDMIMNKDVGSMYSHLVRQHALCFDISFKHISSESDETIEVVFYNMKTSKV